MNRRKFSKGAGILVGSAWLRQVARLSQAAPAPLDRFKLGVISDGLSADFGTALAMIKSYGLSWVEIRRVYGKYNTETTAQEIRRIKALLHRYGVRCSQVDTALFKCRLPGTETRVAKQGPYLYAAQMDLLKRAIERAQAWGTDKLRIFSFWRVAEPETIFSRVREELHQAAQIAHSAGMRLMIENEDTCNLGTGLEVARMLPALPPNVGVNWDIGNGLWRGEVPYPDGYKHLDPKRIWNLHLKGVQCAAGFKDCQETFPDRGQIDLAGQLAALLEDGYQETLSLECEFQYPGLSHAETTRRALQGLLKVVAAVS